MPVCRGSKQQGWQTNACIHLGTAGVHFLGTHGAGLGGIHQQAVYFQCLDFCHFSHQPFAVNRANAGLLRTKVAGLQVGGVDHQGLTIVSAAEGVRPLRLQHGDQASVFGGAGVQQSSDFLKCVNALGVGRNRHCIFCNVGNVFVDCSLQVVHTTLSLGSPAFKGVDFFFRCAHAVSQGGDIFGVGFHLLIYRADLRTQLPHGCGRNGAQGTVVHGHQTLAVIRHRMWKQGGHFLRNNPVSNLPGGVAVEAVLVSIELLQLANQIAAVKLGDAVFQAAVR